MAPEQHAHEKDQTQYSPNYHLERPEIVRCLIACHTPRDKNAPHSERQNRNPGQQLPFVTRDACETIGDDGEWRRRDQECREIDEKANDDQLRPRLLRFRRLRARIPIQLGLCVEWRRNRKVNEQQTARQ